MEIEGLYRQAMNSNTKHCHKTVQNHAYFFHIDYLYSVVRQYSRFIIQCISGSVFFSLKKNILYTYLVLDHPAIGSDKGVNLACSEGCCVLTRENFHAPTYKHTTYTATKILFA